MAGCGYLIPLISILLGEISLFRHVQETENHCWIIVAACQQDRYVMAEMPTALKWHTHSYQWQKTNQEWSVST